MSSSAEAEPQIGGFQCQFIRSHPQHVHRLKARDSTGRWACYVVFVPHRLAQRFLRAIEGSGQMDLEEFGEVIASCYGEAPTPVMRALLRERYGLE